MNEPAKPDRRIIRLSEVIRREGVSRTTIWKRIRAGKFPIPVDLGGGKNGFYSDEYEAHQAALPRVSYAPATIAA